MTDKSKNYLERLERYYKSYSDNDSLLALADISKQDERVRQLQVFREQPLTQELIVGAISRFRECVNKLTIPEIAKKMTDEERMYLFAAMDWARFTLDLVGENPALLEQEIEKTITNYAHRAGLST